MSVRIRVAEVRDVESVARLLMELFEQEADFTPDLEAQQRGVDEIIANPACGQIYVIEKKGQVVGALSLLFTISTALGGKVALLEDFIVQRDFRGQGLGRRLLCEVLERAQAHGCLRVSLLTDDDNVKAQAIYQQAGFVRSSMRSMRRLL